MIDMKKFNLMGIIGVLGCIIMVVGVFLSWVDVSFELFGMKSTESTTGWGIGDSELEFDYGYAPLVALAAGVVGLITTFLPIVYNKDNINKILGIVSLVLAIVSIVLSFMFYTNMDSATFGGLGFSVSAGIGLWMCIVGAIILAVGGIIDIVKKNSAPAVVEA